jgi:hypothetical protein
MTKNGVAPQNQQWTGHHGASRRTVPDGNCRSRFISLCYGTDDDVFERQPKLNRQSVDIAVSTVAKITTYLTTDGDDDTDYVSAVEVLCREIGRGCYVKFDLSGDRFDPTSNVRIFDPTSQDGCQQWTCLYKIVCSPSPAGTRDTATQTRWPGLSRENTS